MRLRAAGLKGVTALDPTANLKEQRDLADQLRHAEECEPGSAERLAAPDKAWRLAELVEALDLWLSTGGSLPDQWQYFRGPTVGQSDDA